MTHFSPQSTVTARADEFLWSWDKSDDHISNRTKDSYSLESEDDSSPGTKDPSSLGTDYAIGLKADDPSFLGI